MFTGKFCHTRFQSDVHYKTGVVVESFSYVFQLVGGTKAITREEMRAFKKVWAEYANPRTGYLEKVNLVPFLGVRLKSLRYHFLYSKAPVETQRGLRSTHLSTRV